MLCSLTPAEQQVIIERGRFHAQREILRLIAHHWRQPLSHISLLASISTEELAEGNVADIGESLKEITEVTQRLGGDLRYNQFAHRQWQEFVFTVSDDYCTAAPEGVQNSMLRQ